MMETGTYQAIRYHEEKPQRVDDQLVVEESLQVLINGKPFTSTMRTPGHDEELVRGLLYTEKIYRKNDAAPGLVILKKNKAGIPLIVDLHLPQEDILKDFTSDRNLPSVSSCGICGKAEIARPEEHVIRLNGNDFIVPSIVSRIFEKMNDGQLTFSRTGGSHAAAAFTSEGELLITMEDIGRHNAVDKVIGGFLLRHELHRARILTVSGRVSYEIVNKCYAAGIPILASVSAPSTMAVEMAQHMGITLLSFCRGNKFTVYTQERRIKG